MPVMPSRTAEEMPGAGFPIGQAVEPRLSRAPAEARIPGPFEFLHAAVRAVLAEGQHLNAWVIGKHKGMYEALVQYAPLPVYRDNNKNNKSEQIGKPIYGQYGINQHRANANAISKIIDKWSAGCQVRNNPKEYEEFMNLCKNSGVKYFSCILFNEKDFL